MFVITCSRSLLVITGYPYVRFLDLNLDGAWRNCMWVKLNEATMFDTLKNAAKAIKHCAGWADYVEAEVTEINELNICT